MSFSVGVIGTKDELEERASKTFNDNNPDPAPRTVELFRVASATLLNFAETSKDEGNFSVSISGHAAQHDTERDYLSISINAVANVSMMP